MISTLFERWRQGHRTKAFPPAPDSLPDRLRGRPAIDVSKCVDGCARCVEACPVHALTRSPDRGVSMDLGRCLFCGDCVKACPAGAIRFTPDYRLSTRLRDDLITDGATLKLAKALDRRARRLFGRSLKLRQVSAGGCNACEADTNVLNTLVFDLARFGIQFVASPRHADGLLVTGPVTENMREALIRTWEAVPAPRIVVAVGACAIAGGPYAGHAEAHGGAAAFVPVDLFIPGCPPHPYTILDGLLWLLGRVEKVGA